MLANIKYFSWLFVICKIHGAIRCYEGCVCTCISNVIWTLIRRAFDEGVLFKITGNIYLCTRPDIPVI